MGLDYQPNHENEFFWYTNPNMSVMSQFSESGSRETEALEFEAIIDDLFSQPCVGLLSENLCQLSSDIPRPY